MFVFLLTPAVCILNMVDHVRSHQPFFVVCRLILYFLKDEVCSQHYFVGDQRSKKKNSDESEGKNHSWYLTTVAKSGSTQVIPASNLLSNVGNQSRGAVLAEPFPWAVVQGVILVFVIVNSRL
jgi:hypothetical protein